MTNLYVITDGEFINPEGGFHLSRDTAERAKDRAYEHAYDDMIARADRRIAKELERRERMTRQRATLAAAGITDPTIDDPSELPAPDRCDHTYSIRPPEICTIRPVNNSQGEPGDTVVMFTRFSWAGSQIVPCLGWCNTEVAAQQIIEQAAEATPDHYEAHCAAIAGRQLALARSIRDWNILHAAGLADTPTRPQAPADPPPYRLWRVNQVADRGLIILHRVH